MEPRMIAGAPVSETARLYDENAHLRALNADLVAALRGMNPSAPLGDELTWQKARELLTKLREL